MATGINRRNFVLGTVTLGAGLTVGVYLANRQSGSTDPELQQLFAEVPLEWDPDTFVRIGSDNLVTVYCKHTEMGQGIHTGMATIVAEELDAAWEQMRVEGAPANKELYSNLLFGEQMTGASASLQNSVEQLRQAGAAVRHMVLAAAATSWGVAVNKLTVRDGVISHAQSDRHATLGEMAEMAALQPVPESVQYKNRDQYRLIGGALPRTDILGKTNGTAVFTQDFKLPGMLTAVVAHAPRFGATLRSFEDRAARDVKGVIDIVAVPTGVAVIAGDFWTAQKARDLLTIDWDETNAFALSSEEIAAQFREIADREGAIARDVGSTGNALDNAEHVIESEFQFPFLAHSPIEPLNCVVRLSEDGCEIWSGAQQQTRDQADAAAILGLQPAQIKVNMLYAGGAFGRRACKDYTAEAVHVAKAVNRSNPIKLVWTREDDMLGGQYRPLNFHRMRGGLDADGNLVAWHHRLVGQSIASQVTPEWIVDDVDNMSVHGARDWLYDVPNIRVETHSPEYPVPVLWYRGVGSTHTVYAVETFMDELADAAGRDPIEFRRGMLGEQPRMLNVLNLAATKANWGSAMDLGRGRGVAMCQQRETYLAQVAEVTVAADNTYSVDRVITAVDCGLTINPDIVRAQMEGGTGFGLSSTVGDEITFKDGYVEQSNFDKYRLLRINQMPDVEVHIVESVEPLSGVGELATMAIGAAVANALYSVTGTRHRKLPIKMAT